MKILLKYLKQYWKILVLALVLATINQIFSLLDPYIFRRILDDYAANFSAITRTEFFQGVGFLLLLSMGTALISRVAKNFQDYFVNTITQKLGAKMYTDGLAHSLQLPYQIFEDQRSGETLEKLQRVRQDVEKLIVSFVNVFFFSLVGFLFVIVYAFFVSWVVAVVYLVTVPILGLVSSLLSKKIKTVQQKIVKATTVLAGSTTESLRNIELVKSMGLSGQEIARLNHTTEEILKLELEKVKYIRSLSFVQGTLINLLRTAILFVMMYLLFTKAISLGQFFSLWIYSFFLFSPLQEFGNVVQAYREAQASLQNFKDILASQKEPKPKTPKAVKELESIEFKAVTFQHITAKRPAISEVSFKVKKGETVAFVGPSGSGKTTLVKMLVGLYRPKQGNIFYNGVDLNEVDLEDLRNQIGLVTQDTQLFAGTIAENLRFVKPQASEQELWDVLGQASAESLMQRADKGLQTVIGEGGVKVSGGEKQRLSIARALLRKPKLMVFDEATSALDSLTEEQITETIRELSKGSHKITVAIAHRLSTIMHSDVIYVLEKGKVAEFGKHDELVEKKGLYYAMWRQQIGEEKEIK